MANKDKEELRITRFIRDIPMGNIQGGASIPNMRQLVHKKCQETAPVSGEIKNREFKDNK